MTLDTATERRTMTPEQERHLSEIKGRIADGIDAKYRKGQAEHGGNLWKKPGIFPMLKDEVRDFVVYADTLEAQLRKVLSLIELGRDADAAVLLRDILDGEPD